MHGPVDVFPFAQGSKTNWQLALWEIGPAAGRWERRPSGRTFVTIAARVSEHAADVAFISVVYEAFVTRAIRPPDALPAHRHLGRVRELDGSGDEMGRERAQSQIERVSD